MNAALFLVTRPARSPTAADTVLILKHIIKSNSKVSNGFLTSSNQSFHQLLCLRSTWSTNSNGKTILACLILAEKLHDTPTSYTDLLFPIVPAHTLLSVQHCTFAWKLLKLSLCIFLTPKCVVLYITWRFDLTVQKDVHTHTVCGESDTGIKFVNLLKGKVSLY